jgi:hypothetical protein
MTTAYTSYLGLALPVTGELSGTWGDTVNNYITQYLDASVAGTNTLSTDADVTLVKTTNAALSGTSSQYAVLLWTAGGTATRTIIAPSASSGSRQFYIVVNKTSSTQSIKLCGTGPTTGVTVSPGNVAICVWNGSDFTQAGGVPSGSIIMWSGSIASIPAGWYLCDGTNSTPNLRDRFIVGAGSTYAVAATGGSANATLVSHTHTASVTDPGHAHSADQPYPGSTAANGGGYYGQGNTRNTGTATTGITVGISTEGNSATNANLPPYYALAYIMKA